jgi:hypothetical protein
MELTLPAELQAKLTRMAHEGKFTECPFITIRPRLSPTAPTAQPPDEPDSYGSRNMEMKL